MRTDLERQQEWEQADEARKLAITINDHLTWLQKQGDKPDLVEVIAEKLRTSPHWFPQATEALQRVMLSRETTTMDFKESILRRICNLEEGINTLDRRVSATERPAR